MGGNKTGAFYSMDFSAILEKKLASNLNAEMLHIPRCDDPLYKHWALSFTAMRRTICLPNKAPLYKPAALATMHACLPYP